MSTLRIRIELNKGGDGAPLKDLINVAKETEKFLRYLAEDFGITVQSEDWVARNFKNESVMWDTENGKAFTTEQVRDFTSGLLTVTAIDPEKPEFPSPIQHRTVAQYAIIGTVIPAAGKLGLGIFRGDEDKPVWRSLSHRHGITLLDKIDQTRSYIGSVQGRMHSNTFEGEKWFYLRANRHSKLIRCDYPDSLHPQVHEATKDTDSFVTVRGRITTRTVDRNITRIAVTSITPNPVLSDDRYYGFFGHDPNYTGDRKTEDAVDDARESDG